MRIRDTRKECWCEGGKEQYGEGCPVVCLVGGTGRLVGIRRGTCFPIMPMQAMDGVVMVDSIPRGANRLGILKT